MSTTTAGILFLASLILALAAVHVPLGDYMYRVYTGDQALARRARHLPADRRRPEVGADVGRLRPQRAGLLGGLRPVPVRLPAACRASCRCTSNDPGTPMTPALAWNTAVSFVTNTNWQAYSGESTMGHLVQMAGLAVQNFVSAAVGIAVAIALVRGFARKQHRATSATSGSTWSAAACASCCRSRSSRAIVLIAGGADPELPPARPVVNTLAGAQQTITGGPVASQEAIKELGTNGGGFYNANSAHPFENPTDLDQLDRDLPAAWSSRSRCPARSAGWSAASKQGYAIVAVMGSARRDQRHADQCRSSCSTTAPCRPRSASAMEGVEQRFGVAELGDRSPTRRR